MKAELGYYLDKTPLGEIKIPIYGLRAVPVEVCERHWGNSNFGKQNWQVEIWYDPTGDYIWINQSRHLVFLH